MELVPVRCRIPTLLKKMGKNQQWLGDITGLPKQRISDYIHLRLDNMTIRRAALMAYHLNCSMDDLFVWEWR